MADIYEAMFIPFREGTLGHDAQVPGPHGNHPLVYADWIASGRLFAPLEERLISLLGPWVANTHSESNHCGQLMTRAYHQARERLKLEINAGTQDILLPVGSGMTGAISKLQRILGLRVPEQFSTLLALKPEDRPVVFLSHMEHHSNHTSWLETIAEVVVLPPDEKLLIDVASLEKALDQYKNRPLKIGSFTAASNVTGIRTPWRQLARTMHKAGGLCFVDFAASAPYDQVDMGGVDEDERLDAVFFSPHKYLGGPGSPGILAFKRDLYHNRVPDQPGGGTVRWTNRWNEREYVDDIESREDGGTPAFLQTIRAALACDVKAAMGVEHMHGAESILIPRAIKGLQAIPGLVVLAPEHLDRIGAISFYIQDLHYNLVVRLLSDRFGIQVRGGCSCAGTYGHYLLAVDKATSNTISCKISAGDLSSKPGWVRLSLHPVTSISELDFIMDSIEAVARFGKQWSADYRFRPDLAEWEHLTWHPEDHGTIGGLWSGF